MSERTCVSLFSGIGGLDHGLARAGFRHLAFCESDAYRREVLAARWPGVPVYEDVRTITADSLGLADRRRGLSPSQRDDDMKRQAWNKGKTYTFAKREVYANKGSWNAAMRRMFSPDCMRCGWDESVCDTHHIVAKRDGGEMTLDNGIILCPNCHRLADNGQLDSGTLTEIRQRSVIIGQRIGGEVLPSEAPQADLVCGGFPLRAKTSQLQDAALDSAAIAAASSLNSHESSMLFDPDLFSSRTFLVPSVATAVGTSESCLERWPTSGTAWPGGFSTHVSSECRSADGGCSSWEPSLSEILEPPQSVPARYSLSGRAARGILRRAEKRGRTLPGHLAEALESVAGRRTPSE